MMAENKRLFVGGLFSGVTEAELQARFEKFANINSVEIKIKRDIAGTPIKTFAYLDVDITPKNLQQCIQTYNNSKWRGVELHLQLAKPSFVDRLKAEQAENVGQNTKEVSQKSTPHVENTVNLVAPKGAIPGTVVAEDWVVGKYSRVLPVVNIRRRDKKKLMRVDPSKFCHSLKRIDSKAEGTAQEKPVQRLTWKVPEEHAPIVENIKGNFGEWQPKIKRTMVSDVEEVKTECVSDGEESDRGSVSSADTDEILSQAKRSKTTVTAGGKEDRMEGKVCESKRGVSLLATRNTKKRINSTTGDSTIVQAAEVSSLRTEKRENVSKIETDTRKGVTAQKSGEQVVKNKQIHDGFNLSHTQQQTTVADYDSSSSANTDEITSHCKIRKVTKLKNTPKHTVDFDSSSLPADGVASNVVSSYSTGGSRLGGQSSDDEDIFDLIDSGKITELHAVTDKKCSKTLHAKQARRTCVTKSGNQTAAMAAAAAEKQHSQTVATESEHASQRAETATFKTTYDKRAASNQKRMDSLREKQEAGKIKNSVIQTALADVDKRSSNKRIVFDSSDEYEGDEEDEVVGDDSSSGQHEDDSDQLEKKQTGVVRTELFGSDSEDAGDEEQQDQQMFEMKSHFEGRAGSKLMQLQSKFRNDQRFKMDARFLESDDSGSESDGKPDLKEDSQRKELALENAKSLEILKSIVGEKALRSHQRKTFLDVSTRRYDPTRKDHQQYEIPKSQPTEPEAAESKQDTPAAETLDEEKDKNEEEEDKKKRYFEVSSSLKDSLQSSEKSFSLLTAFGTQPTEAPSDGAVVKLMMPVDEKKKFSWGVHTDDGDDDDEIKDGEEEAGMDISETSKDKTSQSSLNKAEVDAFFFKIDDSRITDGLNWFRRTESLEVIREKWEEQRPNLVECYRLKRKKAMRKSQCQKKAKRGRMH